MTTTNNVTTKETKETEETYVLEDLMKTHTTKSAVIRFLSGKGWERGRIAKFMGIKYQHVRNVLTQPLKTK